MPIAKKKRDCRLALVIKCLMLNTWAHILFSVLKKTTTTKCLNPFTIQTHTHTHTHTHKQNSWVWTSINLSSLPWQWLAMKSDYLSIFVKWLLKLPKTQQTTIDHVITDCSKRQDNTDLKTMVLVGALQYSVWKFGAIHLNLNEC